MLIDIIADPWDMDNLATENRDVVNEMRPLLPPEYASGCKAASEGAVSS